MRRPTRSMGSTALGGAASTLGGGGGSTFGGATGGGGGSTFFASTAGAGRPATSSFTTDFFAQPAARKLTATMETRMTTHQEDFFTISYLLFMLCVRTELLAAFAYPGNPVR